MKRIILSTLMLAFIIAAPHSVEAQLIGKADKKTSYNITDKDGRSKIRFSKNGKDFQIEYEGDITVSDDDRDIISISNGGYIEIEKRSFGSKRKIVIEAERNGSLTKKYYVGRKEQNYNPEGREWLAEILPDLVRSTRIAAESRVKRFYNQGGTNAVLNEIGRIDSDYVKATYFKLLLKNYNLSDSELTSTINKAGKAIKSDHYLASILEANQSAFLSSERTIDAYIEASKSLSSDHYMTRVLKKVIKDESISDSQMDRLLDISKHIDSDHYVTQVLTTIMDNRNLNSLNFAKIVDLSKDIQSDHYKTRILKKTINEKGLSGNAYNAIFSTLDDIQSDHYVTEVIMELLKKDESMNNLGELLSLVKNNIRSDHYATRIYKKFSSHNISESQLIDILNSLDHVRSDHYMAEALKALSGKVRNGSEKVKSAYRNAAKSIRSETYYGRAMKAIN